MSTNKNSIDIYLETGKKRTVACVTKWPGWCRIGRDEASALQALFDYGPRYAHVLRKVQIPFQVPADPSTFNVIERLEGNATTDFGAPGMIPSSDKLPIDHADLLHFQSLLQAYWHAFDKITERATGRELRKGPRGGGRDLEKIIQHVIEADRGYLPRLAWKFKKGKADSQHEQLSQTRQAILNALTSAVQNGLPEQGPRGGVIWPPRYFVRRVAWHVLDHLWEIEDRLS
ncbi:MAG: hypothetical protein KC419_04090 [Anaerolineales bacterium]|nr:hypothetical protein [Anaerolineales bacterium]